MPWAPQRPQAAINFIFQDVKIKITFFAAIIKLASRSSAAFQILKDLLATWFVGTQQPTKPPRCDSHMPFGHRWHHVISQQGGSSWILCQISQWMNGKRERYRMRWDVEGQWPKKSSTTGLGFRERKLPAWWPRHSLESICLKMRNYHIQKNSQLC